MRLPICDFKVRKTSIVLNPLSVKLFFCCSILRHMKKLIAILFLFLAVNAFCQNKYTISGLVTDENGETLIGVNVYNSVKDAGAVTNNYGFYSLTLPEGPHEVIFSYLGYNLHKENIDLKGNIRLNVKLLPESTELDEVTITAKRPDQNISELKMSAVQLQAKTIKKIPVLLGETDIIKSIQLLPGVQTSVEGSSGFYVRGGNADQNLVLLDEATVYNPAHLFGFFSVFNNDAVKNVELFKGGIPAEYGGRLSSVLDVRMKEGSMEKFKASGGWGMITNRLILEGPLFKNKVSFIVAGRLMTTGLYLAFAKDTTARQSTIFFYDLNAKVNWAVSEKDRVYVSGYFGRDVNVFGKMFQMDYGNATGTVRWNHVYSNKLFSNLTFIYSNFNYTLGVPQGSNGFKWISDIIDYGLKNDYIYYLNPENTIKFGIQSTYHCLKPGASESIGESFINNEKFPDAYAIETGLFIGNDQIINSKLGISYGLRYSLFQNIGSATLYTYNNNYEVVDTIYYGSGKIFNMYHGWEPRLTVRYSLSDESSIKASYNRMFQYMHLASNSTATFPLDLWFMSNPNVKPQYTDQVALGYFRNFRKNTIETSIELYYKKLYDIIDFKDHAMLAANPRIEGELRRGSADAYGLELMVKKQTGKLTGWVSYTYSRSIRLVPEINFGRKYSAPFDKPHNISIVLSYDLNNHFEFSANWVYSSPIPVTVPKGGYYYGNLWIPVYSFRNAERIPGTSYHRLDFSVNYNFRMLGIENTLNLSIYNVYNRHNAFAVNFREKSLRRDMGDSDNAEALQGVDVVKTYLFPIIPAITYNFKF